MARAPGADGMWCSTCACYCWHTQWNFTWAAPRGDTLTANSNQRARKTKISTNVSNTDAAGVSPADSFQDISMWNKTPCLRKLFKTQANKKTQTRDAQKWANRSDIRSTWTLIDAFVFISSSGFLSIDIKLNQLVRWGCTTFIRKKIKTPHRFAVFIPHSSSSSFFFLLPVEVTALMHMKPPAEDNHFSFNKIQANHWERSFFKKHYLNGGKLTVVLAIILREGNHPWKINQDVIHCFTHSFFTCSP